jgi:hypothetical protein
MALVGLESLDPVTSHSQADTSFIHSARFCSQIPQIFDETTMGIMRSIAPRLSILAFIQTLLLLLNIISVVEVAAWQFPKTPHNNNNVLSSNRISDSPATSRRSLLLQTIAATSIAALSHHLPFQLQVDTTAKSSPVLLVVGTAG